MIIMVMTLMMFMMIKYRIITIMVVKLSIRIMIKGDDIDNGENDNE